MFDVVITIVWDTPLSRAVDDNAHTISRINAHNCKHSPQTYNQPITSEFECMLDDECIDEVVNNLIEEENIHCLPPIPVPVSISIPQTTANSANGYSYYSPSLNHTVTMMASHSTLTTVAAHTQARLFTAAISYTMTFATISKDTFRASKNWLY